MATEEINLNVNSNIKTVTKDTENLNKNLKGTAKAGKEAGKEISVGSHVAGEGVKLLDGATGGLASKFAAVGKASKLSGKAMKTAMISSGIGLVVALVATLVQHWDKISAMMDGVSDEQEDHLDNLKKNVALQEAKLALISIQDNTLKLQGKTEQEIRDLKKEQILATIEDYKLQLISQQERKEDQIAAGERNKKILKGIMLFLTGPITIMLGAVDLMTAGLAKLGVIEEATNLAGGYMDWGSKLIFDPEQIQKDGDAAIKETKLQITKLDNLKDGIILQDRAAAKAKSDANKRAGEASLAATQKALDDEWDAKIKANDEWNEEQLRQQEYEKESDERLAALRQENMLLKEDDERTLADKILEIQKDAELKSVELMEKSEELKKAIKDKYSKIQGKINKKRGEDDEKIAKASTQEQIAAFGNLAGALSGLAGDNKELAVGEAIISTYVGANKAFAMAGPAGFLTGAAIIAAGLANVQKIYATDVGGSGGGSSGASAMPPAPQMMSGAFELTGGQEVEPARAYVVSDDITANQNKLAIIRRRATI